MNENNVNTITVKQSDLEGTENAEKFVELFGRPAYFKALQELSIKRRGDGTLEMLQDMAAALDINDPVDYDRYSKLRGKIQIESNKLQSKAQAEVQVPIYDSTADNVFSKRDMAKDYLGQSRYYTAAGFPDGTEEANDLTLENFNPYIKKHKAEQVDLNARFKELEEQRARLLRQQRKKQTEKIDEIITKD